MKLPTGWATTTLRKLGGTVGGKTPSKAVSGYWTGGTIPWVSPKDMKIFKISGSEDKITHQALIGGSMNLLPTDSILMVTRSGILAHTFPVAITVCAVTINQDIKAVRPSSAFSSKWLAYSLRAQSATILGECTKAGTTVASVEMEALESLPIPMPPLPEQTRIADKLDTVLTRVDACRDRLARVAPLLKRFRQSVLAAATSGRLTEDWRSSLELNWRHVRADEVCAKVQSGGTPKSGFSTEGVPFLKVYNIVDQIIDFDYRPQYVTKNIHQSELKKSISIPGDVVMNIVGPPLGKVAIVPDILPEWNLNQAITLFRPTDEILSKWIYIALCEGQQVRNILKETKGSVGQINISLSQCRAFIFPVPTIEEQTEIVSRVETLFAFADRLEARLKTAQAAADRLTPALLAKAFRGELVPQDPNDEPAAELLKRLAASRDAAPKAKRGRRSATADTTP